MLGPFEERRRDSDELDTAHREQLSADGQSLGDDHPLCGWQVGPEVGGNCRQGDVHASVSHNRREGAKR